MVRIPTTIIGSMPKPKWLAADWYSIKGDWLLSGPALAEAQDDATRLAVAEQERAGIDIVCDGEQRRPSHQGSQHPSMHASASLANRRSTAPAKRDIFDGSAIGRFRPSADGGAHGPEARR